MKYIYENKQYSSLDKVFKELLEKCPDTIIICKKCEGKGEIQYSETNWRNGNEYVYSEKCETCNGTGEGDKKLNPIFEKKCFSFLNDITFIIKNKQFTLLELKLPENKNLIKTVKNNKIIATTQKTFKPNLQELQPFATEISNDEIKKEPMFFNCDLQYAYENGGVITKSFINNLPNDWKENVVFDSRVHMLMPKWYPAIPGWHHDDVPRPVIPTGQHFITAGQPDYDNPRYQSEHILGLVNAEICPTQFVNTECTMPAIPDGELIYRAWHTEIEKLIKANKVEVIEAKDRTLIYFDCNTFHTGIGARSNGWRWFGRVSRNTDRVNKITNEIRVNCQVYLEFPMEGW